MTLELRNSKDPQKFIDEELGKEPSLVKRYVENIEKTTHNYLSARLNYMLEHLKLYTNLLTGVWVRLKHIAIACEAVGMWNYAQFARQLMSIVRGPLEKANFIIKAA
ncbi:hypothetical protein BAY1663_00959 [Pseudomonas sp. BAY1663]|uniref:hypothetical protein n=1 Tax=Pseudomonas sp. BAY1663 TaxID=1439940 RepID=UPI00042E0394|nr:hypothetical protein [Pseudomonas sp. BAY1663]EXF46599.1 hypothetical protein BAY1663_00959 [Pseudomonas sp. BAY1663]